MHLQYFQQDLMQQNLTLLSDNFLFQEVDARPIVGLEYGQHDRAGENVKLLFVLVLWI